MSAKRNYGMGTIRQRPNGSWEMRVRINGKQRSFSGKTKKEALERARQAESDFMNGNYVEPSKQNVAQWLNTWLKLYCNNHAPSTIVKYEQQVRIHLVPSIGHIVLQKLKNEHVQQMCNELAAADCAPKTIRDIHGTLHKALDQAYELGYLKKNVSERCKLPVAVKTEVLALSAMQLKSFIAESSTDWYSDLFYIAAFTGMREGELIGLTWRQVDFVNGEIRIDQQLVRGKGQSKYYLKLPKHEKIREITPAVDVMKRLHQVRHKQLQARMRCGPAWDNTQELYESKETRKAKHFSHDFVFTDGTGKHFCHKTVYAHCKRIAKRMGINDLTVHGLRHTFATLNLQQGVDYKTLSAMLGHEDVAFTMNQYGHVTEAMRNEAANRMQSLICSM